MLISKPNTNNPIGHVLEQDVRLLWALLSFIKTIEITIFAFEINESEHHIPLRATILVDIYNENCICLRFENAHIRNDATYLDIRIT